MNKSSLGRKGYLILVYSHNSGKPQRNATYWFTPVPRSLTSLFAYNAPAQVVLPIVS